MSLQDLNSQQLQASQHMEGPMLVLAGAGSGKTKVVTHRIAHLLKLGILGSDILAVTFTNKAANEMASRIQRMCNAHVLTCTFHSLGARILRESIHGLGYSSDFTIYDTEDSLKLLKTCLQSLGVKEEKGMIKTLKAQISHNKNNLVSPANLNIQEKGTKVDRLLPSVYSLYQLRLQENNALDFDDLLYLCVQLLQTKEQVRTLYQNRWLFLLIDEYQDTNHAQYTLIKLLASSHNNIFAVGDPDQSIYSWRGARYQNILHFSQDFPGAKTITLEQNYRSTKYILETANALITHNSERYEKKLWSNLDKGEKVKVYFALNDKKEAEFVAEKIGQLCTNFSINLNEIVIFYRTNSQSRILEDIFLAKQIPYKIIGALSFYQRKEIKDILSIIKMVVSSTDFIAFSRSISFGTKGLGQTTLEKIITESRKLQMPIFSFCEKIVQGEDLIKIQPRQKKALQGYVENIDKLRRHSGSLASLLQQAVNSFSYVEYLQQTPETYEDKKQNVEELISKATQWEEEKENPNISQFLEELTLVSDRENTQEQNSIQLMTIHNGKGLEFKAVFIVGLEEDLFPHANCKEDPSALEEERRLAYVAMTRAKKILFLCGSRYRHIWGAQKLMLPSRFLQEIPVENLENLSDISLSTQIDPPYPTEGLHIGDLVEHKEFGRGAIQRIYHTSYGITYDVFFHDAQITRSLVAKFAKLEKIL